MARARVGERQAGLKAEARGVRVDADEPARVLDLRDDGERRGGINPRARRARSVANAATRGREIAGSTNTFPRSPVRRMIRAASRPRAAGLGGSAAAL